MDGLRSVPPNLRCRKDDTGVHLWLCLSPCTSRNACALFRCRLCFRAWGHTPRGVSDFVRVKAAVRVVAGAGRNHPSNVSSQKSRPTHVISNLPGVKLELIFESYEHVMVASSLIFALLLGSIVFFTCLQCGVAWRSLIRRSLRFW